jgi:hypothetical protein
MTATVTLIQPVQAYGEPHKVLTFREPNGKDIRLCGFPIKFLAGDNPEAPTYSMPDAGVVHALIARLANIPPSAVDTMCLADLVACQSAVMGFFGEGTSGQTSSTDTTTSPGNGNGKLIDSSISPLTS